MIRFSNLLSGILLVLLFQAGCRTTHHLAYDGQQRAVSETATLQGMQIGGQYNWASARIERIGEKTIAPDPFAKLEIIHALTGKQQVDIAVVTAYQRRRGSYEFDLLPGHAYEVRIMVDETMIPKGKLVLQSAELFDLTEQKQVKALTAWGPIEIVEQGPATIYINVPR